jgi:multiple antibiotic resistance protein
VAFGSIDGYFIAELVLLLILGIGPKIALLPYLTVTAGMDGVARDRLLRKMMVTAGVTAFILLIVGEVLRELLHFSTAALAISGGLILFLIAVPMVLSTSPHEETVRLAEGEDPLRVAVFPLAVPYVLNPSGMVVLVTLAANTTTLLSKFMVIAVLGLVLGLDVIIFRYAERFREPLNEGRMLIVEKVSGFLLAAVAIQLLLNGLIGLGLVPRPI